MSKKSPLIHIDGLIHFYGSKKVLDIDQFSIEQGSIIGLQGPNGSGKTTLLKLLAFAMAPSQGQICFKGRPEHPFSPGIRSRITLLAQKPYLLKRTVHENIAYGLKIRKDTREINPRIRRALSSVGLDFNRFAQRKWNELSGGEAQRVAMAARLILKPELLLLDEPVASVDNNSADLIRQASLNARREWGTTLVIASHDLQWLYECSDSRIYIARGKLFSAGHEIIIPGPYEPLGQTLLARPIGDTEPIRLPRQKAGDKTAVLKTKDLFLACPVHTFQPGLDNQIIGQVISMMLESQTGHTMTRVKVHDLDFILSLAPETVAKLAIHPGQQILIGFDSTKILWR